MGKKLQFSPGVLRGIRRPSQPVTGPVARQREKTSDRSSFSAGEPGKIRSLLVLPLVQVALYTAGGGAVVGLGVWIFGAGLFGLGFFLGSLLALAGLFSLKALTTKVFEAGKGPGLWLFHGLNIARWFLMALVYYALLKISLGCLLGAVTSYMWFLAVLAWLGLKSAKQATVVPAPSVGPSDDTSK